MSERNLEVVARGYAHFAQTGDVLEEISDPDFVWDMSTFRGWPEQKCYSGPEGTRRFLSDWTESWEDWKLEIVELVDAGGDLVLAICHQSGRSKATGLVVEMDFAQLWTVRDGLQLRMRMYADPAEARREAGLTD